jgi:hypothetical protein
MAFDIIPWNPLQYQAESDRIIYSSKKKKKDFNFIQRIMFGSLKQCHSLV